MGKMVRITVCIEPETQKLVQLLSRRHGHSVSEIVRQAIEAHWVKAETSKAEASDPLRAVDSEAARLLDLATVPGTVFGGQESVDPAQEQTEI